MAEQPKAGFMEAKLLIVEDEARLRASLRECFEREEFGVAVAEDGARALAILNEVNPDLLILDVQLPEGSGHSTPIVGKKQSLAPIC